MAHSIRPRLRAEAPDGFEFKESLTILAPDGQMNVIASSGAAGRGGRCAALRRPPGRPPRTQVPGLSGAALRAAGRVRRPSGLRALVPVAAPTGGRAPAGARDPDAGLLRVARRGYTATATVPSFLLERWRPVMEEVMRSLRLAGPGRPRGWEQRECCLEHRGGVRGERRPRGADRQGRRRRGARGRRAGRRDGGPAAARSGPAAITTCSGRSAARTCGRRSSPAMPVCARRAWRRRRGGAVCARSSRCRGRCATSTASGVGSRTSSRRRATRTTCPR